MLIVAEVAQAHDGSLGTAIAYIQAIAAAGADAAKFQDHTNDACLRFRPGTEGLFVQDATRADYWKRTSFTTAQWRTIADACHDAGIEFICSPFSMQAFENVAPLVDRWKIGSSKVNDYALIDACVATGKPVILSSGMSHWEEIEAAMQRIPDEQRTVLHCVSAYPTPPEMSCVHECCREIFDGISDHSGTIWPSIVAAATPMDMAEVHVVFSRECFGPDVTSSITTGELRQLVEGVRFIERAMGGSRAAAIESVKEMREVFGA